MNILAYFILFNCRNKETYSDPFIIISGNLFPSRLPSNECTTRGCVKFPDNNLVDYAVGAPNVLNENGVLSGVVYLCPNCFMESDDTISIRDFELTINGYQFGEKFGQTVMTIDIDGDSYDDLIVGAPLHSTDTVIRLL